MPAKFLDLSGNAKAWSQLGIAAFVCMLLGWLVVTTQSHFHALVVDEREANRAEIKAEREASRAESERSRQHGQRAVEQIVDAINQRLNQERQFGPLTVVPKKAEPITPEPDSTVSNQ